MRRVSVHTAFAAVATVCVALAGYDAVRLGTASRIDDEVRAIANSTRPTVHNEPVVSEVSAKGPALASDTAGDPPAGDHAPRAILLAKAMALSAAGQYAAAGRRFEALVEDGPRDAIGRAALFDLGNMYLREGAGETADAVRSLPMIEQAKARYRALLRVAPDDWDARYNLERALRLAPETQEDMDASKAVTKHGVRLRGAQSEDLP
ncbi:mxaK protein [Trinickia symbiotica]|uniref:MxaK protein n=1 Tax=Trinickia symbiotica TaxID=863227 RepID=A0A2N7X8P1_9BURK|nr:hypothetical protein [Trinickia symbiotica]PMS37922.1 hypothetical protein C0Z20_03620 [Trinickia symbiotica]PPK47450.1 mxaK protein [Trinickia symbiotica]